MFYPCSSCLMWHFMYVFQVLAQGICKKVYELHFKSNFPLIPTQSFHVITLAISEIV